MTEDPPVRRSALGVRDAVNGPAGQQTVRAANLGAVLRTVRRSAPCSRAEVAAATGLTKATVSSLVGDLISRGLVCETGAPAGRQVGRPGIMLALDERTFAAIGLEVNVDYLTVVAVDLLERELLSRHVPFDAGGAGPEACVGRIGELVAATLSEPELADRSVLGVSVAVPGLIDAAAGTVARAPNLGWRDFPLRDRLTELLEAAPLPPMPVLVDNDGNLGAVAEYRSGHLAGTPDLVYITGEVGIGAGLLMNGELVRGSAGYGGELGHLPLLPDDGPLCACGARGCLEALAGIGAILRRTVPALVPVGPISGADLAAAVAATVELAEAGDGDVRRALHRSGTWLGRGAAAVINLVDPRAVILGGYFGPLSPWLLPGCASAIAGHTIAPGGGCRVEVSVLGLSAAARGGAAALIDALDTGRLRL